MTKSHLRSFGYIVWAVVIGYGMQWLARSAMLDRPYTPDHAHAGFTALAFWLVMLAMMHYAPGGGTVGSATRPMGHWLIRVPLGFIFFAATLSAFFVMMAFMFPIEPKDAEHAARVDGVAFIGWVALGYAYLDVFLYRRLRIVRKGYLVLKQHQAFRPGDIVSTNPFDYRSPDWMHAEFPVAFDLTLDCADGTFAVSVQTFVDVNSNYPCGEVTGSSSKIRREAKNVVAKNLEQAASAQTLGELLSAPNNLPEVEFYAEGVPLIWNGVAQIALSTRS